MKSLSIYSLLFIATLCIGTASMQAAEASPRELERLKQNTILSLITSFATDKTRHHPAVITEIIDGYTDPLICYICQEECADDNEEDTDRNSMKRNFIRNACPGSNVIHPCCFECITSAINKVSLSRKERPTIMHCGQCGQIYQQNNIDFFTKNIFFDAAISYANTAFRGLHQEKIEKLKHEVDAAHAIIRDNNDSLKELNKANDLLVDKNKKLDDKLNIAFEENDRLLSENGILRTENQIMQQSLNHQNFLFQTMQHRAIRANKIKLKAKYKAIKNEKRIVQLTKKLKAVTRSRDALDVQLQMQRRNDYEIDFDALEKD